jgi:hypothetical protein
MVAGKKGKFSLLNGTFSIVMTMTQHSVSYLSSSGEVTLIPRQINHNETSTTDYT